MPARCEFLLRAAVAPRARGPNMSPTPARRGASNSDGSVYVSVVIVPEVDLDQQWTSTKVSKVKSLVRDLWPVMVWSRQDCKYVHVACSMNL